MGTPAGRGCRGGLTAALILCLSFLAFSVGGEAAALWTGNVSLGYYSDQALTKLATTATLKTQYKSSASSSSTKPSFCFVVSLKSALSGKVNPDYVEQWDFDCDSKTFALKNVGDPKVIADGKLCGYGGGTIQFKSSSNGELQKLSKSAAGATADYLPVTGKKFYMRFMDATPVTTSGWFTDVCGSSLFPKYPPAPSPPPNPPPPSPKQDLPAILTLDTTEVTAKCYDNATCASKCLQSFNVSVHNSTTLKMQPRRVTGCACSDVHVPATPSKGTPKTVEVKPAYGGKQLHLEYPGADACVYSYWVSDGALLGVDSSGAPPAPPPQPPIPPTSSSFTNTVAASSLLLFVLALA